MVDELAALAREAELPEEPRWLWNPLDPSPTGLAFGRPGSHSVALMGGLVTRQIADPPAFRSVVRHELAHLRNHDVDLTYATVSLWYAFLLTGVLPFVLVVADEGVEHVPRTRLAPRRARRARVPHTQCRAARAGGVRRCPRLGTGRTPGRPPSNPRRPAEAARVAVEPSPERPSGSDDAPGRGERHPPAVPARPFGCVRRGHRGDDCVREPRHLHRHLRGRPADDAAARRGRVRAARDGCRRRGRLARRLGCARRGSRSPADLAACAGARSRIPRRPGVGARARRSARGRPHAVGVGARQRGTLDRCGRGRCGPPARVGRRRRGGMDPGARGLRSPGSGHRRRPRGREWAPGRVRGDLLHRPRLTFCRRHLEGSDRARTRPGRRDRLGRALMGVPAAARRADPVGAHSARRLRSARGALDVSARSVAAATRPGRRGALGLPRARRATPPAPARASVDGALARRRRRGRRVASRVPDAARRPSGELRGPDACDPRVPLRVLLLAVRHRSGRAGSRRGRRGRSRPASDAARLGSRRGIHGRRDRNRGHRRRAHDRGVRRLDRNEPGAVRVGRRCRVQLVRPAPGRRRRRLRRHRGRACRARGLCGRGPAAGGASPVSHRRRSPKGRSRRSGRSRPPSSRSPGARADRRRQDARGRALSAPRSSGRAPGTSCRRRRRKPRGALRGPR